jgi:hypothetical protein
MSGAMRRSLHPTARFPGEKSWPTLHTMKHHECIVRICQNHSLHISQKLSSALHWAAWKSWWRVGSHCRIFQVSRCWGGGSGSRGALDQETKSVKAGVKDNNHPGKNGAVHVITGCTRSRWTIDIYRLLHGRVLSKCLVTWQHAVIACNVFLRVAQVNCLSHFLVLGLVWRSFYSISGMPVCLMPKCRSRLHERYLQCCGLPDEKVQANDLLV